MKGTEMTTPFPKALSGSVGSLDARRRLEALVRGLADQQAMPDNWWEAELAAVLAALPAEPPPSLVALECTCEPSPVEPTCPEHGWMRAGCPQCKAGDPHANHVPLAAARDAE